MAHLNDVTDVEESDDVSSENAVNQVDFFRIIKPLITEFAEKLAVEEERRLSESIKIVKLYLADFVERTKKLIEAKNARAKSDAPDYNVFEILKLERKEQGTHSAFLANLLDPNGLHGQGTLFLDAFLEMIGIEKTAGRWRAQTEVFAGYVDDFDEHQPSLGRMDIVLENGKSAVVIENKIDSGDQPNQLWRYGKWLTKKYGETSLIDEKHFAIFYLTLRGGEPSRDSTDNPEKYDNDSFKLDVLTIKKLSYKKDIAGWLTACIEKNELPLSVKTVIKQYLYTIKRICA